jgi:hypothetical protein
MRMNSPSSFASPPLLSWSKLPQDAVGIRNRAFSTQEVFHRKSGKTSQKNEFQAYCAGDSAGVSSPPVGDSVVAAGASVAAGLVISVAAGGGVVGVGLVAGVTVSVFCSHAARSAAPARTQMYFFIVRDAHCFSCSISASAVLYLGRMFLKHNWLDTRIKKGLPISSHAPRLPRCK